MKTFTIKSTTVLEEYCTYTVEAENAEEALQLVEDGEVEDNDDHWTRDISGGPDFKVIEEK